MYVPTTPKIKSPRAMKFFGFLSMSISPNMVKNKAIESLPEHLESTIVTMLKPFKLVKATVTPSSDTGTPNILSVNVENAAVIIENEDKIGLSRSKGTPMAMP